MEPEGRTDANQLIAATPAQPGAVARTFQSLRVRNFRFFVAGQLLSATGTWMQSVAAPLLVFRLTHSGTALGIDTGLTFLPILLFGAWGGLLADRFDNRKLQIATQIGYASIAAVLALITASGVVAVWMIYACSFASGLVTAVDMPTRQSFYLEVVGPDDLTNAMSLNTATFNAARIFGSVLGALVVGKNITLSRTALVFLANAISYVAVVGALLAMRTSELRRRAPVPRRRGQIREGIRYAWRTATLRVPLLVMAVVFVFAFNLTVLLPLLVLRTFHGNATGYGRILALFGAGSLAGSLTMAGRSSRANVRQLTRLALVLGVLTVATGLTPWVWLVDVLMVPVGAAALAFAITANSTLQLNSSDDMRGRVMAIYTIVFLGSTPIGGPLAGLVGQHLGARTGLLIGGIAAVVAGAVGAAALTRRSRT